MDDKTAHHPPGRAWIQLRTRAPAMVAGDPFWDDRRVVRGGDRAVASTPGMRTDSQAYRLFDPWGGGVF